MSEQSIKPILDQNACDFSATGNDSVDALVQQRLQTMGPTSVLFYREPLVMERGEGAWLYDSSGRRYLDAYNNVAVLGHSHPAVQQAVNEQLGQINTHSRYLHQAGHDYAQQLLATLPAAAPLTDPRLLFTCTGSEANDLAIRLAWLATGRKGILVSEAAYHGNTFLVNQVSPSSCRQLPDWVATFSLDALRDESISAARAEDIIRAEIRAALARLEQHGHQCAALLADSIFSSDGVFALPHGFLAAAVDEVRAAGGLFIADEVQPGFARTGEAFWGFNRHSTAEQPLIPDLVTFGKPMGNGYPVAGLVAADNLLQRFAAEEGYFNTFAGSHAAIAAAQAVLNTISAEQLQQNAADTGAYLKQGLQQLQQHCPRIRAVRGSGLFIGVDIATADGTQAAPGYTSELINQLRRQGVLIGAAGKDGSTLKIRPPLCFGRGHADIFLTTLSGLLSGDDE